MSPPVWEQSREYDEFAVHIRECLDEVFLPTQQEETEADWDTSSVDKAERWVLAAKYQLLFRKLLAFAKLDHPLLRAGDLTSSRLLHHDNGKLLQTAAAAYAAKSGLKTQTAKHELMAAVVLHEHGTELLQLLIDGRISTKQLEFAVAKLKSVTPPDPEAKPDGSQWQADELEQAESEVNQARTQLAADLVDIAQSTHSDNDFRTQAAKAREHRHPETFAERAARAAKKRFIKFVPCEDGMTRIEGMIPSHAGLFLHHILTSLAASYRALGQAKGRSRNNLMADLMIDLLLNNPYLPHALEVAKNKAAEKNTGEEADGGILIDDTTGESLATQLQTHGETSNGARDKDTQNADVAGVGFTELPPGVVTHVIVTMNFEEYVNLGGCLDQESMGFAEEHYPELYAKALQNQDFYSKHPRERKGRYPAGVRDAECGARAIDSDTLLSPQVSADLIASAAMMSMIMTDSVTGYPLGAGRKTYRPNARMRMLTAFRDRHCRYPGCREPLSLCELDHVVEWRDGGGSDYSSLSHLCKAHHTQKTARWITATIHPERGDGVISFTNTQTGQSYLSKPEYPLAAAAWQVHRNHLEHISTPPF